MIFLDICCGGGLATTGIHQAGHKTLVAIEREKWIADVFKLNFPETLVRNEDCAKVDYSQFKNMGIDAVWASFPCQGFSNARSKKLEEHKDVNCGYSLIDAVELLKPLYIFLENVPQWLKSQVWIDLRDYLFSRNYWVSESVLNAADYGVPQNRKRAIIRCVKSCHVPFLQFKQTHFGWYAAISDLISSCPVTELANWQKELIKEDFDQPVLIPHVGARKSSFRLIKKGEPAPTLRALGHDRHWRQFDFFDGENLRQLIPECEARLQTMSSTYNFGLLPNWKKKKIIGNGVPSQLVRRILKEFP